MNSWPADAHDMATTRQDFLLDIYSAHLLLARIFLVKKNILLRQSCNKQLQCFLVEKEKPQKKEQEHETSSTAS